MTSLPLDIVANMCKHGQGQHQCRFLGYEQSKESWICCKLLDDKKQMIYEETSKLYNQVKGSHRESSIPVGDNCEGFTYPSL
jgi:hypothetical protein